MFDFGDLFGIGQQNDQNNILTLITLLIGKEVFTAEEFKGVKEQIEQKQKAEYEEWKKQRAEKREAQR